MNIIKFVIIITLIAVILPITYGQNNSNKIDSLTKVTFNIVFEKFELENNGPLNIETRFKNERLQKEPIIEGLKSHNSSLKENDNLLKTKINELWYELAIVFADNKNDLSVYYLSLLDNDYDKLRELLTKKETNSFYENLSLLKMIYNNKDTKKIIKFFFNEQDKESINPKIWNDYFEAFNKNKKFTEEVIGTFPLIKCNSIFLDYVKGQLEGNLSENTCLTCKGSPMSKDTKLLSHIQNNNVDDVKAYTEHEYNFDYENKYDWKEEFYSFFSNTDYLMLLGTVLLLGIFIYFGIKASKKRKHKNKEPKESEDNQKELEDIKKELEDTKKELKDIKKELEDTQKELEDTKKELEDTKKELKDTKKEKPKYTPTPSIPFISQTFYAYQFVNNRLTEEDLYDEETPTLFFKVTTISNKEAEFTLIKEEEKLAYIANERKNFLNNEISKSDVEGPFPGDMISIINSGKLKKTSSGDWIIDKPMKIKYITK